jgi:hypothetical protein
MSIWKRYKWPRSAQVPVYVKECVKIFTTDNKIDIDEKLRKMRLRRVTVSGSVRQFRLIGAVDRTTCVSDCGRSHGANEQEIQAAIKDQIDEDQKRQKEAKKRERANLEREMAQLE